MVGIAVAASTQPDHFSSARDPVWLLTFTSQLPGGQIATGRKSGIGGLIFIGKFGEAVPELMLHDLHGGRMRGAHAQRAAGAAVFAVVYEHGILSQSGTLAAAVSTLLLLTVTSRLMPLVQRSRQTRYRQPPQCCRVSRHTLVCRHRIDSTAQTAIAR